MGVSKGSLRSSAYQWTDERIERLRELRWQGASYAEIGLELFGTSAARAAVAGVIHRRGLDCNPEVLRERRERKRIHDENHRRKRGIPKLAKPVHEQAKPSDPSPSECRCTLAELTSRRCRWPIGDPRQPGFFFCGSREADLYEKRPYCRHHAVVATTETNRKRYMGRHFYKLPEAA